MNIAKMIRENQTMKILMDMMEEETLKREEIVDEIIKTNEYIKESGLKIFSNMEVEIMKGNISEKIIRTYETQYIKLLQNYKENVMENTEIFECEYKEIVKDINDFNKQILRFIGNQKTMKIYMCKYISQTKQMIHIAYQANLDDIKTTDSFEVLEILNSSIQNAKAILNTEIEENKLQEILTNISKEENISDTESIKNKIKKLNFRYKELIEMAKNKGFEIKRFHGSHAILKNDQNKVVVIPNKPGTAPKGLQYTILKSVC